ncbi:E4 ORF-2 [Bovine adenovirus 10]|uniref:E4 ORF-2 n=1 Tax=Bovine adenovirus C serotype 10 TaxID=39788 RepID=Q8QVG1_ADEBA|nr:URF-2 [Bovine adenovirus 10]UZF96937.1 E4 ORF-2 [Bovine adenovirus 10]
MSPVPVYAGTLVRVVLAHAPQFKAVHGDEFFIKLAKLAYKFIYEEFCSWPVSSAQHPTGRNDFIYVNSCSDLVGDFFFLTLFLGLEVDNLDAMMAELEDYLIVNLTPHTDFELNLQVHRAQKSRRGLCIIWLLIFFAVHNGFADGMWSFRSSRRGGAQ